MSVFTKRDLESRLDNGLIVNSSKIKEIRIWILGHKLHFQAIVRIWFKELIKSHNDKKLAFMYLACDVIWHSIKNCPEFVTEFGLYMEKVFEHLVTLKLDEKAIGKIGSFIKIWRKRRIFDEETQGAVEKIWKEGSVDDIVLVKEFKKEKDCIDELPPHLTCSVCSGLLKEPVLFPCCKTALCKLCAFAKLEQRNTCWFEFCPKSVVICKDEVIISPELSIQVDLWKTQNKEGFKENSPVTDLETNKNVGLQINASIKMEDVEKSSCIDTRAKGDALDSKILSSENMSKSDNNKLSNGQMKEDKCGLQKKGHSCNNHWLCEEKSNADCLLQWVNPSGEEKEQCAVSAKDSPMRKAMKSRIYCDEEGSNSPMRKAMKRRIYCNEEGSEKKSQMCKQSEDDSRAVSGIERISDATNSKEKTLVTSVRTEWVKVCGDEMKESINIATENDGTLLLSSVTSHFPGTTGLKYRNPRTNFPHYVRYQSGIFLEPKEGWAGIRFVCVRYNCMKLTKNLIVHGLSPATREDDVKKYFEKFGEVLTVRLIKQASCFALIRFAEKAVELAVISQTHMIDARWCLVTYSNGNEMDMFQDDDNTPGTVFVGKVTEDITSEDLRKYFESFGHVMDVHFSQPRKNFAFIEFRNMKVAMSLCTTWHVIKGAHVIVDHAKYEDTPEATQKIKQYEDAHEAAKKTKPCGVTQQEVALKTKREDSHCKIPGSPSVHKGDKQIILELPNKISVQDIRFHFEKFGEVIRVQLIKSFSGELWGNALIKFNEKEVVDKIIGHQLIGDQWCNTVRVTDSNEASTSWNHDEKEREIYVGQITEAITAQDLKNHFKTFGQVTNVHIPRNSSFVRRNFALVRFSDRNVLASLLGRGDHVIKGVTVKIEKAV